MKNINLNGAKNSALPIIAATILQKNIYYIRNIPLISDIKIQLNILKQFNVKINFINKNSIIIDTTNLKIPKIIDYTENTRGCYYFIGSTAIYNIDLEFIIDIGCKIDERNIDYHIKLLELLGKTVIINDNKLLVSGTNNNNNITYTFPKPSIGATLNAIFMYSNSKSKIILNNYAKDPYIINTIEFLKKIGINIEFNPTSIIINGNDSKFINNTLIDHSIIIDPIEALTYIIYAGINLPDNNISNYTIGPIDIFNLGKTYNLLKSIGIFLIESEIKNLYFIKRTELKSFNIETGYFPDIYTDIQPMLTLIALSLKDSISTIKETIWNNRFKYIDEINLFGYKIILKDDTIIINTNNQIIDENYINKEFECTDLRGGMAILLLMRKFHIKKDPLNKKYIDRGYYDYEHNINIILKNDNNKFFEEYNTKDLSNIKIGNLSKYYAEAFSEIYLINIINYCKNNNIKFKLIGYGNNIYFCDYFDGMIIKYMNKNIIHQIEDNNEFFIVSAGTLLIDFIIYISQFGYDLSNLAGIPGTIGGAINGNAGAYGLEISEIIENSRILRLNNLEIFELTNKDINFSYRNSKFKNNSNEIILSAKIKIKNIYNDNYNDIKKKISNVIFLRNTKFPWENTLGSVFKNYNLKSNKIYAWKLIDELNLRGKIINNIKICDEHPNIFLNYNNASSNDFNLLLLFVEDKIKEKYSIIIQKEIEFITNI